MSRCPVFNAADVLGKRWTIPLLQQVGLNGRRSAYALTPKGKELTTILDSLRHWHDRHSGSARCLGRDCTACPLYA